jgi:hypothetical protein
LRAAGSLAAMNALAAARLEAREAAHLRAASAVKLLELAAYRPYELELSDCQFIRAALQQRSLASAENWRHIAWHVTMTCARLIRGARLREALALTPPALLPKAGARWMLQQGVKAV